MTTERLLEAFDGIDPAIVRAARDAKPTRHRKPANQKRLLPAAAVLLLLLALAAFAFFHAGDWFKGYFEGRSGQALTPKQENLIETQTVGIGQSQTVNGWTVAVESAICDPYTAYIKVRITAPEDVVLAETGYYFDEQSLVRTDSEGNAHSGIGTTSSGWQMLEDDDGKANTITLMNNRHVEVLPNGSFSFADGSERCLRLENLMHRSPDYPFESTLVTEGVWSFAFVLTPQKSEDAPDTAEEIELITEPLVCQVERELMRPSGVSYEETEVKLISLKLTALGASCEYTFFEGTMPQGMEFREASVVLKDGTEVALLITSGGVLNHDDPENALGLADFQLISPIDLQEVDYVLFPGGLQIPMP